MGEETFTQICTIFRNLGNTRSRKGPFQLWHAPPRDVPVALLLGFVLESPVTCLEERMVCSSDTKFLHC